MPLIFAVDSDKRQSAQLASLLRSHVDADLVQSATVLDGIGVLQGRIPDLVLTSSLLSPRDESALANHMRELGTRAAHVHTLTIPVLAAARKASKKRPTGVLGALRREKDAEVETAGCQPEVFAKEVRIYLERAVEERAGTDAESEPTSFAEQTLTPDPWQYEDSTGDDPTIDAASVEPDDVELLYSEPAYAEPAYTEPVQTEPAYPEPAEAYTQPAYAEPVTVVETEFHAQAPELEAVVEPTVGEEAVEEVADPGPGGLYLDRPEIIARDSLMAQPPDVVADAFAPPKSRVPVVDMNTFDDLDSLADQLAAPSGSMPMVSVPASDPFEQFFVPQSPMAVEAVEPLSFAEFPDDGTGDPEEAAFEPADVSVPAVTSDTWFDRMAAAVHDAKPAKPEAPRAPEPVFSWIDNQTVSSLSDVLSRVRASDSDAHEATASRRAVPPVSQAPAPVAPTVALEPLETVAAIEAAPEPAPVEIAATARPEVIVELVLPPAAPLLDPEVLAMFGAAVHRAGLDALGSLSSSKPVQRDQLVAIPSPERPARVARESKAERRARRKPAKPAQDEWGMYDPGQCGPAALFDEDAWNEIDTEERTAARRPRAS